MAHVIAEGTKLDEISEAVGKIAPGQIFDLQLFLDGQLSKSDIALVYDTFLEHGIAPQKLYQDRMDVLHIYLQKPEGIGWIPLVLALGALTFGGYMFWRITKTAEEAAAAFTSVIIPAALILTGGLITYAALRR